VIKKRRIRFGACNVCRGRVMYKRVLVRRLRERKPLEDTHTQTDGKIFK